MSDPGPSLARSGAQTFATSLTGVAVGIATSIVIARWLGAGGKGAFDLSLATAGLLALVLGLSAPSAATFVIARGVGNPRAVLIRLAVLAVAQGLLAIVLLAALAAPTSPVAILPPSTSVDLIGPVALVVCALALSAGARAVALGRQRIAVANAGDLVGRISLLALLVLAWVAIPDGPVNVALLAVAVSTFLAAGSYVRGVRSDLRTSGPAGLRAGLRFTLPAYAGNVTQYLNYRLDLFLVGFFLGPGPVGVYALAVSLAQLIWLVSNAAATVLLPRAAASQHPQASAVAPLTAQTSRVCVALSAAFAVVLAVSGPIAIPLLYGEEFRTSVVPMLLLLPGVVVFSSVNVIAATLAGLGRPSLNAVIAFVGLAVTVPLDLLLIPAVGIAGAALTSSFSYLAATVIAVILFRREGGQSAGSLLIIRASDVREAHAAIVRRRRARTLDTI